MSKPKSLRARLTLTTAMAGALLVSYGGRTSYAGTCVGAGGVYTCSGGAVPGEAGVSIDYGGEVTVTTSGALPAGFGIDTTGSGDTAISIKADGGLTFDDTNTFGSVITGDIDGLYAKNENGGALTITTKGPVTGLAGDGIEASNDADGTSLTISAASVGGATRGIDAQNDGTGDLDITTTGQVSVTAGIGILATNNTGGSLTIDAKDTVFGTDRAILANNGDGTNELTLTTTGVDSTFTAIEAFNRGTGDLRITTNGAVTGTGGYGIRTRNYNGGDLIITANKTVSGSSAGNYDGIRAVNVQGTRNLTISAADVDGDRTGILASNNGTGAVSVAASGLVVGMDEYGIEAFNTKYGTNLTVSAAAVQGGKDGIRASNYGSGFVSVSASGTVTGVTEDGILAKNSSKGSYLTISAAGVSGGQFGIYARNDGTGDLSITTKGLVSGGTGDGISAKNDNGGALTVTAKDTVSSSDGYGILAYNGPGTSGLTISAAAISSMEDGIAASHQGSGDLIVTAAGTITSLAATDEEVDGIDVNNAETGFNVTVSAAAVTGQQDGIDASNVGTGALSIFASAPVIGIDDEGIDAFNSEFSTNLTIEAIDVSGGEKGIQAINSGFGDLSITTTGTVTGETDDGIRALNDLTATNLTISAAAVSGDTHGIYAENAGTGDLTITADGTVTSGEDEGIDARITNAASGGDIVITTNDVNGGATGIGAAHDGTGSIEITASGTVFGGLSDNAGGFGIIARIVNDTSTGDVTVTADSVTSEQDGISARNEGAGSITVTAEEQVTATNVNADGIVARNFIDGDVTVSAASVDGGRTGILASNRGDGSLYVSASGTVTGQTGDGILAADDFGSNGLNVGVAAADVRGGVNGIFAQNIGTGFLSVAAGNVTGETGIGIRASLVNGTDLTITSADVHAGTIGIFASNGGDGSLSITAGNVTGGLGGGGNGITANLGISGDNLTISAASVSGADTGINAVSEGTGALSVTASGPVFGASADGIFAKIDNPASTADLTVSTAGVTGAVNGILADHQGLGDIIISASGPVEGIGNDGITFVNTAAGGAVTIEADAAAGGRSGIRAEHEGTGALSITAGGDVTGDNAEGIFARINNAASGADLTISAMAVSGGTDGIDAKNLGSGNVFVTTSGPVTADGDGYGIRVGNFAGGDVSIAAADTGTAPGTGIAGRNYGPMAGNVTITAAGVTGRTGIVASNQGMGSVSVTATGTVMGTAESGGGINALNTGGTDIEISTEDVIGGARGISARNTGTGSTFIDANGTVTGLNDIALYAYNGVGGGDITVSAIDVDGGNFGILARSRADGSISVTASGDVTGAFSDGIRADAASLNATQVTVAAQSVFGEQRGIDARNNGIGDLEVVAEGTVTGGQFEGIRARITNTAGGGDLTVSAAGVSGGTYGIVAEHRGSGDLSITAGGTVVGGASDGIRATNTADGAHMTISAASVIGGGYGIFSINQGTGDLSVTTEGAVSGAIADGIFAWNYNGGALSVTATEMVTATNGEAIYANNFSGTTSLTISAAGISAGQYGIIGRNEGSGDFAVTATGAVASTNGAAIFAENLNGGALDITAEDDVVSTNSVGINARNLVGTTDLTIEAAGIDAGKQAINALNEGTGDLTITTMGPATGGTYGGIVARNVNGGSLGITAMDTVTATDEDGMYAFNDVGGTHLTVSAAGVSGNSRGIFAFNQGSGDLGITTTGQVIGNAAAGITALNAAGGDLSIVATESVSGQALDGIFARNLAGTEDLTVSAAGVGGANNGIVAINDGAGAVRITSSDVVVGDQGNGIFARAAAGGTDLMIEAAEVTGATHGIAAENRGSGDLTVVTEGPVEGGTDDGMYLRNANGGALSVTATEHVASAELNGIRAINYAGGSTMTVSTAGVSGFTGGIIATNAGTGDIFVTATGEVSGGPLGDGMRVRNLFGGSLSITTTALVSSGPSPVATAIFAENEPGGTDLSISATDVFGNWNGITARHYGDGALDVTTTGSVTGATGVGIRAYNKALGSNLSVSAASVTGGTDAIQVDHQGSGDLLVTVAGAISGGTGAGINNIDTLAQGGTIEVTETASVSAASGVAVMDGDGGTLLWSAGALAGDVMLSGGEDEVALIDGSATGLLGLGSGDDTMEIFGAGAGGGWDDAGFSGTFDNNLGQVLQIDGGDGLDTVELFGVTAASQALGVPTGLEALALSGNTLVQANDADLTPFGTVFVDPTSTLQAEGNSPSSTVVGSLGNEGVVDLADGEANDVLRVTGDFAGATGSRVLLDLDTGAGTSDTLVIEGDVTDVSVGPFTVIHDRSLIDVNLIGPASRTPGDGIRLIEVSGAVDGDDFALRGPLEADIFGYELVFEDGVHFLRSDFFDQIYLYENLPGAMQTIGLALTGQLVERVGVRSAVPSALTGADGNPVAGGAPVDTAIWGRAVGLSVESEGDLDSITGTSFDQTIGFLQAGVDVTVLDRQSGRLLIGALGHWGTSSLDANTFDGDDAGSANFDFYGGGLTATWYSTQGWYFDNVVQYTAYDIDVSTASRFSTTSTDGYAITTSHEVGYRIPISETAALVPQAQLTYQHIDFDDFTDPDGVRISLDDGDSLIGRAGLAFENSAAIGSALATGYVEANVLHEFLGDNSVNVATGFGTTPISQETRGTSMELGFGGTVAVSRGVSLYAEVDYTIPFDNGVRGFQALGGLRVNLNPPPAPPPPAPVIAPVAETAFIVFFDWDRADLTAEANLVLNDVVVVANQSGYASIRLDGYTDLSGSAAYNLGLSERRANSVANGLIARGIAPDEIVIRAFGEENPLVPTPDGVREPQNRRVEIFLS
ncbi:MAG: autotransporter outer membrane beta-barrel domain-containing protein [Pseudomonadota bacterium]